MNIKSIWISEKHAVKHPKQIINRNYVVKGNLIWRILSIRYDQWELENGYDMRWKVGCTSSDLKRTLLDILKSKTKRNCVQEASYRSLAHNMYKNIGAQLSVT